MKETSDFAISVGVKDILKNIAACDKVKNPTAYHAIRKVAVSMYFQHASLKEILELLLEKYPESRINVKVNEFNEMKVCYNDDDVG